MYDFKVVESEVLNYWEKNKIYDSLKSRNAKGKKFYFLQGPPYTSGRLHLGQAWNHALKDMVLRYKRMNAFDVWDRGGYDMHGLPTEKKVQAKFKLETKKDILKFGEERFIEECYRFSEVNAEIMSEDLWKLGVWLDNKNAYMPIKNSFMEGEWFLVKKAHEKNRLYKGKKVMTWCRMCETALAKHELEYKTVKDVSIFVKFKIVGKENEYLIIWTTTPWTIPFNLAVMVNPELKYLRAKVGKEVWIVSSVLAGAFIRGVAQKEFEVLEEFTGEELLGLEYEHPFADEIPEYKHLKNKANNVHTIILSEEYVDTSSGTGLVHCAPGCGPEDYEVGKAYGIPAFNDIDELGKFGEKTGKFAGLVAKRDDKKFVEVLKEKSALIDTTLVEHEYAHCGRCHSPIIFRATEQWFFKTEDLKDKMIEFNKNINWYPETAKNAFDSWLKNLKDNSITRQRFWGTPVPIWICEKCGKYEVIGSIDELKKKAMNRVPENLHKPWIDIVRIKCSCGSEMKKDPDVLDVWIDAGTTSWNCLDYPKNQELFRKYFPADFIVEGKDQIRGWFNLLMVSSVLAFDKPCFENVCMHGFITDVEGEKMSKSLGNIVTPGEVTEKFGADTLRYYVTEITAGEDMNFSLEEVKLKHRNLMILWNLHSFILDLKQNGNIKLKENVKLDDEEKYIISRLNSTVRDITNHLEAYHVDCVTHLVEEIYMDLSRKYVQLIRDKAVSGTEEEKEAILYTLVKVYIGIIRLFSVVCPFITEKVYLNLKDEFGYEEESVHCCAWPKYEEKFINPYLEKSMDTSMQVIQGIMACRDKEKINVRWPLRKAVVYIKDKEIVESVKKLEKLILRQANIKQIDFVTNEIEGADFSYGKIQLDTEMDERLEEEGYARELMRRVQSLRKEAGLKKSDRIELYIHIDVNLDAWVGAIVERCGVSMLHLDKVSKELNKKSEGEIKGKKFVIGF